MPASPDDLPLAVLPGASGRRGRDGDVPAGAQPDDGPRAVRLIERAERLCRLHEVRSVESLLRRAEALADEQPLLHARILSARVAVGRLEARYDDAMRLAKQASDAWKDSGDVVAPIDLRLEVARILLAVGDPGEALNEGLLALEEAEAMDHPLRLLRVAESMQVLAYVYGALAQYERSIAFAERAAESARLLGDVVLEGSLLGCIGCAHGLMAYAATAAGQPARASELLERALSNSRQGMALARQGGHRRNEATALANVAESLVQDGRPDEALALMETWPRGRIEDLPSVASHHLDTHGTICMALGRHDEAVALFDEAFHKASTSFMATLACEHLAEACERAGDLRAALTHYKRFHALFKQSTSDAAQRSASVAAVHLETRQARASADQHRTIAEGLQRSNENLLRRADDLMRLSLHDPLTGLANRRLMERRLLEESDGFGILMIDVDRFKVINDGWSHVVGDAVLRQVAQLIRNCCREADTPVRYGGDEFAILLSEGGERRARDTGERLRARIDSFDWTSIAASLTVSVSVGCASTLDDGGPSAALLVADRRLYEAKHAGRNRVVGAAPVVG